MATTTVTIRGIEYTVGSSTFICAAEQVGNESADGLSANISVTKGLNKGTKYKLHAFFSGKKYPYRIAKMDGSIVGYYQENVFPYGVSYDANDGSGAPTAQTKIPNETLTLSTKTPTRTGYTFVGWGSSSTSTKPVNQPGGKYTGNKPYTYYAIWTANKLTVNYFSNNATEGTFKKTTLTGLGEGKNVKVCDSTFNYDTNYVGALPNVQNINHLYLSRTGYSPTKYWGTSQTGGKTVHEDDTYTGGKLAEALGKDLSTGDKTIDLYPQWKEHVLTVNYWSNYATSAFSGALNPVGADKNVIVRTAKFNYDDKYLNGHWDYSYVTASTYLGRTGYIATGDWGTKQNGGTLINEHTSYNSGQALAAALGKDLSTGDASIDLYPQWKLDVVKIQVMQNGEWVFGSLYVRDDTNTFVPVKEIYKQESGKFNKIL